jgi:hypothetical protein
MEYNYRTKCISNIAYMLLYTLTILTIVLDIVLFPVTGFISFIINKDCTFVMYEYFYELLLKYEPIVIAGLIQTGSVWKK